MVLDGTVRMGWTRLDWIVLAQMGAELDNKARSAIQAHLVEYADSLRAAFEAVCGHWRFPRSATRTARGTRRTLTTRIV